MLEAPVLLLIGATFLLGGFVKGALGLGLPVVVIAILATTMGLKAALAIFLIPAVISNIWQALSGPALPALIRRMWTFLLAAMAGIWIGTGVLARVETGPLEILLGVLLIAYSLFALFTPQLPPPGRHERWMSPVAGGSAGVVFGMTGIFIVPGILYLQALGMKRDMFVQALGLTFVTISSSLLVGMVGRDLISGEQALVSALVVAPTLVGLVLGQRLRHRISEDLFRKLFFIALIGVGLYSIARAAFPFG